MVKELLDLLEKELLDLMEKELLDLLEKEQLDLLEKEPTELVGGRATGRQSRILLPFSFALTSHRSMRTSKLKIT